MQIAVRRLSVFVSGLRVQKMLGVAGDFDDGKLSESRVEVLCSSLELCKKIGFTGCVCGWSPVLHHVVT